MKVKMTRIKREFLDNNELETAIWLDDQIDRAATKILEEMIAELRPEPVEELIMHANAHAIAAMPFRLHLLKTYLTHRAMAGELHKLANGDEYSLYHAQCLMEDRAAEAMLEYSKYDDEEGIADSCDCPDCRSRREFEGAIGGKLPKNASFIAVPKEGEECASLMAGHQLSEENQKAAINAEVNHAWRCKSCKGIQEGDRECRCGGTEFAPVVVLDVPLEQMVASEEMKEAEKHITTATSKVIH
jgi:hypothetical protein